MAAYYTRNSKEGVDSDVIWLKCKLKKSGKRKLFTFYKKNREGVYPLDLRWCTVLLFSRYTEIANNFQKEETVLNIDFVLLDNSPLKFALLSHCNEWQNKFTTLLREMGSQKLLELHNFLKDNAKK